jgi:undecaprenol kinase
MQTHSNKPFLSRLRFALGGVRHTALTERSLQIQSLVLIWVVIVLADLRPSALWWALATLSGTFVLAVAVEHLTGHPHPELHPEITLLKHCADGTALVAWLGALGVALALLIGSLRRAC